MVTEGCFDYPVTLGEQKGVGLLANALKFLVFLMQDYPR